MNLSIEYLERNILLCRWHKEGGLGDPYIASCVIHYIKDIPYIKGLTIREGKITFKRIKELKDRLNIDKFYFERDSNHAVKTREV